MILKYISKTAPLCWAKNTMNSVFIFLICFFALFCSRAEAHRINVFAYTEGSDIVAQGYLGGKTRVVNSVIQIFDSSGNMIHEGMTNSEGIYRVSKTALGPISDQIRIVLQAGMGHQAEYLLALTEGNASSENLLRPQTDSKKSSTSEVLTENETHAVIENLEKGIDKKLQSLNEKLDHISRKLAENESRGPQLSEILGGIGWILGLFGIWAFCASRSNKKGSGTESNGN